MFMLTPFVTGNEALRPSPRSLPRRFQNTIRGRVYPCACTPFNDDLMPYI